MPTSLKHGISLLARGLFILFLTGIGIEISLQIAFMRLPASIIQTMPQYPIRYGIRFDTPHGAREYPAHEVVDVAVTATTGDLYSISCLTLQDAPPFEPYRVNYTRDSQGFRNPEPYPDPVDLVIVGDSFTAAETIQRPYWHDLQPTTLAFGLPGSGSLEQNLLLKAYGLPRQPTTVIMAYFGGNDLVDTLRLYTAQQAGKTLYSVSEPQPWEYLVTFHLALQVKRRLVPPAPVACPYPVTTGQGLPVADYNEFLQVAMLDADELAASEVFALTRQAIVEAAQATQAAGGRFILMYIPFKLHIYWSELDPSAQLAISADMRPITLTGLTIAPRTNLTPEEVAAHLSANMDAQRDLLQTLAQAEGFDFLDLTPGLLEQAKQGEQLYFYSDTHWNQAGHDAAHAALLALLQAES